MAALALRSTFQLRTHILEDAQGVISVVKMKEVPTKTMLADIRGHFLTVQYYLQYNLEHGRFTIAKDSFITCICSAFVALLQRADHAF